MAKIYIFGGGKGGVGKTTACLALVKTREAVGSPVSTVFDGDATNPDVLRALGLGVDNGLNAAEIDSWRGVLAAAEKGDVVVNLPGGGDAVFLQNGDVISQSAAEAGHQVLFVSTLNRSVECIQLLKATLDHLEGTAAQPVVVLNEFFGPGIKFFRYKNSKQRERIKHMGGLEIVLPELAEFAIDAMLSQSGRDFEKADAMTKNIYKKWLAAAGEKFNF